MLTRTCSTWAPGCGTAPDQLYPCKPQADKVICCCCRQDTVWQLLHHGRKQPSSFLVVYTNPKLCLCQLPPSLPLSPDLKLHTELWYGLGQEGSSYC